MSIEIEWPQALSLLALSTLLWLVMRRRRRWALDDYRAREECGICSSHAAYWIDAKHGRVCHLCHRAILAMRSRRRLPWRIDNAAAERLLRAIFDGDDEEWKRGKKP